MPKIKKNPRGTWEFVVDLGYDPATGKRIQARRSGFRTKKEAEEELRRLQNEADKGVIVKKREGSVTFEEFAQEWLQWYTATAGVKQSTIENRRRYLKQASNLIGAAKIKELSKNTYDRFLLALSEKYKPGTLNCIHVTVAMVLDYAVECGYLAVNPARMGKKPKAAAKLEDVPENIEEKYLTRAEVDRLLTTAKDYGDFQQYALLRLLIFSGVRIGEALALEFKHIDIERSTVRIRQTMSTGAYNKTESFVLQTPKTASSIRDIELDSQTLEILKLQMTEQKKNRLKAGSEWYTNHNFLFTSPTRPGYPWLRNTIAARLKAMLKTANIDKPITLHSMRHTHASLLAESGASLEQIQARLGHANDNTTRQIYLHITKDSNSKMIDSFECFMQM